MENPELDNAREQHTTAIFLPEENDNDDDHELTDLTIPNPLDLDDDKDESLEKAVENCNQDLIDELNIKVESAEHSSGLDGALEPASVDDECEHNAVADVSDDEVLEHSSFDEVFEPVSADGAFNQAYKRFSVDKAYKPVCMKRVLKPASNTISTQPKTTEECKSVTKEVNSGIKLNLKKPDFTINSNIPKWTPTNSNIHKWTPTNTKISSKIPTCPVSTQFTKLLSGNSVGGTFIQNHGLLRGRILPPGSINIPKSVSSSNMKFFHKPVLTGVFSSPSNVSQNIIGKCSPPIYILPKGWNPETLRSQTVIPIGNLHNPAKNQTGAYLNPPASNRCQSCENCKYPHCLHGHFCLAQQELNRYIQTPFCCFKPCLNPPIVQDFPQIDKVFSRGLEELYHVNPGKHVISDNTSFIQLNPSLSRFPVNPSSTASSVMPVNHSVINNPNNLKSNIYSTSNESPSTIYKLMPSSLASINESKFVGSLSLPDQQANVNPKSCAIFQSNEGLITSNLIINSKCTKPKHPLPLQLPSCSVKSANASFVNPPCSRKNPLQILHSNRRIDFASESFSDNLPIDETAFDDEILKLEQSLTSELSRTLNLTRFGKKIINKTKSVFNDLPKFTEVNSDLNDLFYTEIAFSKDHLQTGQDDTNLLELKDHKLDMNHTVNEIINEMISKAVEHYSSKFDPHEDQSSQINLLCTETPLDSPKARSPLVVHNNSNNHKLKEDSAASRLKNDSSVSRSEEINPPCKKIASEVKELLRITEIAKEVLKRNEVKLSTKVTFKTEQELLNESRWIRRKPYSKSKHFRQIAYEQTLWAQKEKIKHLARNKNQTLEDEEGNQLFFMDNERIAQLKPIRLESTLSTCYPGTYQQEKSTHKLKPKVNHSPNLSIKVKKNMLPDPTSEKDQSAVAFHKKTNAPYIVLGSDQNKPREQGNNPGCLQAQGNTHKHLQAKGNTHRYLQEPVLKLKKSPVLVETVPEFQLETLIKINRPKSKSKENVVPLIPDTENQCPSALMDHCISTVINKGIAVSQFFETQMKTENKKNTLWTVKLISRKERLPHLEDHTYYKPFGTMIEEMMNVDLTDYALDPLLIEGQEGMENENIYFGTEEDDISGTFNLVDDNAIENMKSANCESSEEEEEAEDFFNDDEVDNLSIMEEHLNEYSGVRQQRKKKKSEDEDYIPASNIQISGCSNDKFISTRNMLIQQKTASIAKENNEREICEEGESTKKGRKGGPLKSKKFENKDINVVLIKKIKQQREAYEQFWRDKDPNGKDRVQLLEDCETDPPRRDKIPSRNDKDLSKREEVLYRKERKQEKKKRVRSPSLEIEKHSEYEFMKEVDGVLVDYRCFWCKVLPRKGSANKSELYRHYTTAHFYNELKEKVGHFTSCPICRKDFSKGCSSTAVSHMGQVHSYVEAFLPEEAWIPESRGVKRRRVPVSPSENLKTEERKDRKVKEDCRKNKEEKTAENDKSLSKKFRSRSREGLLLEVSGKQDKTLTEPEKIPSLRSSTQKLRLNGLDKKPRLDSSKQNSQPESTDRNLQSDSSDPNLLLDSSSQKPQSDSSDQKPQSDSPDPNLLFDSSSQKPQSDSSDQKPQSDSSGQKPQSDSSDKNLLLYSLDQNPLAASTEQKPQSDFSDQKPQLDSDSLGQKLSLYLSEQKPRSDSADQKTQSDLSDQKSLTDSADQKPQSDLSEQKTRSISPKQNRGVVAINEGKTASNIATIAGQSGNWIQNEEDNPKIEVIKNKYDYDDYDELLDSD